MHSLSPSLLPHLEGIQSRLIPNLIVTLFKRHLPCSSPPCSGCEMLPVEVAAVKLRAPALLMQPAAGLARSPGYK